MNNFESVSKQLVSIIWGTPLVICVLGTAVYLLLLTTIETVLLSQTCFRITFLKKKRIRHQLTLGALTTALGGTIEMGNIAGVAIALQIGGSAQFSGCG